MTTSISIARRWPRRCRSRAACAQAQLADHRRDAPLDRGDRSRRHRSCWPSAAGSRWHEMPLWLAARPLVLASKSAVQAHDAGGCGHSGRGHSRRYRRARGRSGAPRHRIPARSRALLAREKARAIAARLPGRLVLGADQTLALGERRFSKSADRDAARDAAQALARANPRAAFGDCAGARRRRRVRARRGRAADACARSRTNFSNTISTPSGDAVTASVGGYQLERPVSNCSSGSKATISRSSACRCCRCCDFLRRQRLSRPR